MGDPIVVNASDLDQIAERLQANLDGSPDPDDLRRRVAELHAEGHGRNAIARQLGIAAGTVSRYAADQGLTFDRTANEAATRARRADILERRSLLELSYLEDAERLREQAWQPQEYAATVGGESPRVMRWTMDRPVPADQQKLMQASTLAAAASQKITDAASDQSAAAAKSMLVQMMTGLEAAFREVQAAETDPSQETTP